MPSPADVLRKFFIDRSVAVSPTGSLTASDWPVVAGPAPTDHDRYISIRDTGAIVAVSGIQRDGSRERFPTVQVRVRAATDPDAWTKSDELVTLLCRVGIPTTRGGIGVITVTIGSDSTTMTAARPTDDPTFLMEEEENRRQVYVFNVRLTLTPEA